MHKFTLQTTVSTLIHFIQAGHSGTNESFTVRSNASFPDIVHGQCHTLKSKKATHTKYTVYI